MTGKIRVGLVGASVDPQRSWGTRAHIPALKHLPDFELTAVCTTSMETASASAAHFNIPLAFASPLEMARHPDIDLVAVAVRAPAHAGVVKAAASAGKHIFCDWPLGISTGEATELLAITQASGVRHMIGLQSAGVDALQYVKDLISQGFVGRVRSSTLIINHEPHGPVMTEDLKYVADAANGVNLLTIAGGHTLSGLEFVLGPFSSLSAIVDRQFDTAKVVGSTEAIPRTSPDHVIIMGGLASGAVACVHLLSGAMPRVSGTRWEINGTEGDLLLTSSGAANINRALFEVRGARGAVMEAMPVPEQYRWPKETLADGSPPAALANLYQEFAHALNGSGSIDLDFRYALRMHKLLDVLEESSRTGVRQMVT